MKLCWLRNIWRCLNDLEWWTCEDFVYLELPSVWGTHTASAMQSGTVGPPTSNQGVTASVCALLRPMSASQRASSTFQPSFHTESIWVTILSLGASKKCLSSRKCSANYLQQRMNSLSVWPNLNEKKLLHQATWIDMNQRIICVVFFHRPNCIAYHQDAQQLFHLRVVGFRTWTRTDVKLSLKLVHL
jgi:hypothetical protein